MARAAGQLSPLVERLAHENLEKQRVGLVPGPIIRRSESVVGRPVCTQADARASLGRFERRLESIVTDCERIGCLPILIIPPGNDASDPSQSYALPEATSCERQALFERLPRFVRTRRATRPAQSQRTVRSLPSNRRTRKPITAWHGCSSRRRSFAEANRHYVLARDHDGLPMRC